MARDLKVKHLLQKGARGYHFEQEENIEWFRKVINAGALVKQRSCKLHMWPFL